jgi:hypothetical protein
MNRKEIKGGKEGVANHRQKNTKKCDRSEEKVSFLYNPQKIKCNFFSSEQTVVVL